MYFIVRMIVHQFAVSLFHHENNVFHMSTLAAMVWGSILAMNSGYI